MAETFGSFGGCGTCYDLNIEVLLGLHGCHWMPVAAYITWFPLSPKMSTTVCG
jgi:hypothetical protein